MTPESLLALMLLATPPEEGCPDRMWAHAPAVKVMALGQELLDPREARYTFARPEDFQSDIKAMRVRYREMEDAPRLADATLFPPREVLAGFMAFNRAHRGHLEARASVDLVRSWQIYEAIIDSDRLHHIYDLARDAGCPDYFITFRRGALKRLRSLLGDCDYYAGRLPPHVPLWSFTPID